jgi:hypothetical protein
MRSDAVLITTPAIDFSTFLGLSHQALGYSPSSAADASPLPLSDTERFLSCLSALKDQHAPVTLSPHLLTHVSFSVLVAADERDLLEVLECCAGMPFVQTDTLARGIQIAVVTGTLAQWRDAVISGCQAETEVSVRALFNTILARFEQARLKVWDDCARKQVGPTFLLEDKRGQHHA